MEDLRPEYRATIAAIPAGRLQVSGMASGVEVAAPRRDGQVLKEPLGIRASSTRGGVGDAKRIVSASKEGLPMAEADLRAEIRRLAEGLRVAPALRPPLDCRGR
jgi:hypothetical protein